MTSTGTEEAMKCGTLRDGRQLIDVIATREYDVDGKPGITIAIAKPILEEDGITWRCEYDVDGPMEQVRFYACGVDAYALDMHIDVSDENAQGRLSRLDLKGKTGLPRLVSTVPPGAEQAEVP